MSEKMFSREQYEQLRSFPEISREEFVTAQMRCGPLGVPVILTNNPSPRRRPFSAYLGFPPLSRGICAFPDAGLCVLVAGWSGLVLAARQLVFTAAELAAGVAVTHRASSSLMGMKQRALPVWGWRVMAVTTQDGHLRAGQTTVAQAAGQVGGQPGVV